MTTLFQTGFPFDGVDNIPVLATDFIDYTVVIGGSGGNGALVYTPNCYVNGGSGAYVNNASGDKYLRVDHAAVEEEWVRVYVYLHSLPVGGPARISRVRNGLSNSIAGLLVGTNGHFFIADANSTTALWTSANAYDQQWVRLEWRVTSPATGGTGIQRLRIYSGTNIFGVDETANFEESTIQPTTAFAGGITQTLLGSIDLATNPVELTMDAVLVQDTGWPGPITLRPQAAFTPYPPAGPAPLVVPFTNLSTNAATYIWDFGDNTPISTKFEPTHTYLSSGTYLAQLTAVSANGVDQDTLTQTIVVTPGLTAPTTLWSTGYETGTVGDAYTDASLLKLGQGTATVTTSKVIKGTKALEVDGRLYGSQYEYSFTNLGQPIAFFRTYVTITTPPLSGRPMILATALQDGAPIARIVVTDSGKWQLCRGANGETGNLSAESVQAISHGMPVRIDWMINPETGVPGTQTMNLYLGSNVHGTAPDVVVTGAMPGTAVNALRFGIEDPCNGMAVFDATAIGQDNYIGAVDSPNADPSVPVAGFTASRLTIAAGQSVSFKNKTQGPALSYAWNFGDASTSTATSPTHTFASGGTFNVTLTATGDNGTSAPATLTVTAIADDRGQALPKVRDGGTWKVGTATGTLVNVREAGRWTAGRVRVYKDGQWSSNDPITSNPGESAGWGLGTAGTGSWFGCMPGQSNIAQDSYDLAKVSFTNLDAIRAYQGKWTATWSGITAWAKLSEPDIVHLSMPLADSDWPIIASGTQPQIDALYARMLTFCNSIPNTKRVIFTGGHEPETKIGNIADYTRSTWLESQRMWQQAVKDARAARTSNKNWLKYAPVLTGWTMDPRSGRDPDLWHTTGMDAWGYDAYYLSNLKQCRDYANLHNMQWLIGEFAHHQESDATQENLMLQYWIEATQVAPIPVKSMLYWQDIDDRTGYNSIITPTNYPRTCAMWASICVTGFPPPSKWP